jgi:hypothetical protein
LVTLFRQSSELVADLRDALADIDGVRSAAILGSFARNAEKVESASARSPLLMVYVDTTCIGSKSSP